MSDLAAALALLQQDARPAELAGMARFGINIEQRLGLSVPALRRIAKTLGHDHALALALWDTGIPDARIVAGMVAEPAKLSAKQMDAWAKGFSSWDVCDQVCGSAFVASPLAWRKVEAWAALRPGSAQTSIRSEQCWQAATIEAFVCVRTNNFAPRAHHARS